VLEGVTVPLITPMSPDDMVDLGPIPALLDIAAEAQVDAIMVGGTSGEGHALSAESLALLAGEVATVWRAVSRAPARLFVTVTAPSTALALERAHAAGEHADAVVLGPPYYFRYTQAELIAHYAAFEGLGRPVIAYDTPRYSGNPLTLEVRRELAAMPHVVGMKDSAGDAALFRDTCALADGQTTSFEVGQGDERAMVTGLRAGATGVVPGPANLAPGACVRLYRAVRAGELDEAVRLQARIDALSGIHGIRRGVATTKAAMALLGLAPAAVSRPFLPLDASETARVREILVETADITGRLPV
jgi:4-hydroxy-tetrahydrodipicolinate synthase